MKYIDAEKLKAEIEKRLKNTRDYMTGNGMKYRGPKYYKSQGKESVYDAILNIIDSLQQEQPKSTCKTCGFYENNCPFIRGKLIPYPNKVCKDYIHSVMKEQEQQDENLDEAARDYGVRGNANGVGGEDYANDLAIAFKAGAQWMKEQLTVK